MSKSTPVRYCPIRAGILCDGVKPKCDTCGWHPAEEHRRKQIIRTLVSIGQLHGQLKI